MRVSSYLVSKRILVLFFLVLIAACGLFGRLVYIQLVNNEFYLTKAMDQRMQAIPVDAARGAIYDRNGIPLVISVSASAVYAVPAEVTNKHETATILAEILDLDYEFILKRLSKKSASEWLKKRVSQDVVQKIYALNLAGIGTVDNPERYYPYGSLAPQVLGFVGIDNQGLEGIELYYDSYLRGQKGKAVFERDAIGQVIEDGIVGYSPSTPGADLVLTLDFYIQQIADREVIRAAQETGSKQALIVITDPITGEILANAVYPSFDLLNFNDYPVENRRNIAVTDTYEPGSTFKAVTAAAALDAGVASLNTHFFDPGFINVSGWTIRCWNRGGHGSQSFIETLENSCNPFYAKLGMDLGGVRFYDYLGQFGFGQKLGIDFPGEVPGTVRPPSERIPLVTWANIGFGQGLTVTPLQLLAAFGAIANNGIFSVPHYVKEIRTETEVVGPRITEPRQIIASDIAQTTAMTLRSVIENGSGKRAEVDGYEVSGKTGTAQVVENGRYSHSKTITSFAGFAPEINPQMAGIIILWEPQGSFYGGVIAAPIFARLVEQIMPYLGVKPEQKEKINTEDLVLTPDVVGMTPEKAVGLIHQQGFAFYLVGEGDQIVDQFPAANARVERGTKILIYTDLDYLPTHSDTPNPFGV